MDKMGRYGENKTQRHGIPDLLPDAAPVMPCQNSLWITGLRIYGEGRHQDRQGLY